MGTPSFLAGSARPLCVAILLAGFAAGCQRQPVIPPIVDQPGSARIEGKVVWRDLITTDVAKASKFYGDLFGWQVTPSAEAPEKFAFIRFEGRPIGSIVSSDDLEGKELAARWIASISVPDVDVAVQAAAGGGGKAHIKSLEIPNRGKTAVLIDPQGAPFAVLASSAGDPQDAGMVTNSWLWTELWAKDAEKAADYYAGAFGYTVEKRAMPGFDTQYHLLKANGKERLGVVQSPVASVTPAWLPYIKVADAVKTANRAVALGGKIYVAPSPSLRSNSVAILADPTGGVFAVQEWPVRK
jgi:predicted enzyme related to lactoylglutathione lyase